MPSNNKISDDQLMKRVYSNIGLAAGFMQTIIPSPGTKTVVMKHLSLSADLLEHAGRTTTSAQVRNLIDEMNATPHTCITQYYQPIQTLRASL